MKDAVVLLAGIARPIPGVGTYVTPVFVRPDGSTVVQNVDSQGRVARFDPIELGEEFQQLNAPHFVCERDPALYGFEIDDGYIAFGPAADLAERLTDTGSLGLATSQYVQRSVAKAADQFAELATLSKHPGPRYSFVAHTRSASPKFDSAWEVCFFLCILDVCETALADGILEKDSKSPVLRHYRLGNALRALGEYRYNRQWAQHIRDAIDACEAALLGDSDGTLGANRMVGRERLGKSFGRLCSYLQNLTISQPFDSLILTCKVDPAKAIAAARGLITVAELRRRMRWDLVGFAEDLKGSAERESPSKNEERRKYLKQLAALLDVKVLPLLIRYLQGAGLIAIDYRLPGTGARLDVVLLGAHRGTPVAMIIEFKNSTSGEVRPGSVEGLMERCGRQYLHPSDEIRGYAEFTRRFHSAVRQFGARVYGCVLMDSREAVSQHVAAPNDALVREYPVFNIADDNMRRLFEQFLASRLTEPHREFAEAFVEGAYEQGRSVIRQIAEQIRDSTSAPFKLVGNQRRAFALCKTVAEELVQSWETGPPRSQVVVIVGPPGSGKSAIAARLWAELSLLPQIPAEGGPKFVTTNSSQHSNWSAIFDGVHSGGQSAVRTVNSFYPIGFGQYQGRRDNRRTWREELQFLRDSNVQFRDGAKDKATLVSIVDEAHALVNPERRYGSGHFGFPSRLGPQAYHVMRSSLLTVFLLDPQQSFRLRENTTIEDLQAWAFELGAQFNMVHLEGTQFRCAGSTEYVGWVETLLSDQPAERKAMRSLGWHASAASEIGDSHPNVVLETSSSTSRCKQRRIGARGFDFQVFDDPFTLEEVLRQKIKEGHTARLLSSSSRPWKTLGKPCPHGLPSERHDFCEPIIVHGKTRLWHRPWNSVPEGRDYTAFVQGTPHSAIAQDMLAEVGCAYTVRGFDFDYVGLLWLEDLVWRENRWRVDLDHTHNPGLAKLICEAKREQKNPSACGTDSAMTQLIQKVEQEYRILLSRALKGLFVWVKDEETREHVLESLAIRRVQRLPRIRAAV